MKAEYRPKTPIFENHLTLGKLYTVLDTKCTGGRNYGEVAEIKIKDNSGKEHWYKADLFIFYAVARGCVKKTAGMDAAAVVGDWNRINKNATDEIKEQFKEGNIGVTAAAAASQLSEDEQNEIAAAAAAGEDIKATEIQKIVDEKKAQAAAGDESDGSEDEKKEKRSITEQKTAQMSDTDTTEEEKANARRLHALKMLEKYYIYMSDEEVSILERMLEDCKRRKREYGIEDVGSTI